MRFFRRMSRKRVMRKRSPFSSLARKAVRKAKVKSFNKRVLKVIHKQAENKIARTVNNGLSTSTIDVPDAPRVTGVDCFPVIPSVTSTPSAGTFYRIGEKIKARSLVIKGYYYYTPQTTVNTGRFNNLALRIMVVQPKEIRDLTSITSNSTQWIQQLLQNGSSTQQFSNSVTASAYLPLNSERITKYYDKVFYLNQDYILQTTASGETNLTTKGLIKHFSIRIPVKNKTLLYDANINSGLTPTNFNPVLMAGIVQMDGFSNLVTAGKLFYTSELQYEDI